MRLLLHTYRRLIGVVAAAAFSGQTFAIGLGAVAGEVVLGQPVNLTIPLQVNADQMLDAACFQLRTPAAPSAGDYVLRDGYLRVERAAGRLRLVVVGPRHWPHPVLEFRIVATCDGAAVVRDYVLLTALPDAALLAKAARQEAAAVALPVRPAAPSSAGETRQTRQTLPPVARAATGAKLPLPLASIESGGDTLTLTLDTNLNALARSRYPTDRAARDEFRRQLALVNPALFAGRGPVGAVPLPAGTVLKMPPDLPAADSQSAAARPRSDPIPPLAQRPSKVGKTGQVGGAAGSAAVAADQLTIGGNSTTASKAPGAAVAAAAPEVARLDRMLEEQVHLQEGVEEKLKNLEIAFATVSQSLLATEQRLQQAEAALAQAEAEKKQAQAQLAEEQVKFGLVDMLLLVLVGGASGAALIYLHDRLRRRRLLLVDTADLLAEPGAIEPRVARIDDRISRGVKVTTVAEAEPSAASATSVAVVAPANRSDTAAEEWQRVYAELESEAYAASAVTAPPEPSAPAVVAPVAAPPPKSEPEPVSVSLPEVFEFTLDEPLAGPPPVAAVAAHDPPDPPELFESSEQTTAPAHKMAFELAEVMESMGLTQGAAETLVGHIRESDVESIQHWLKLLDLYHKADLGEELAGPIAELKDKFNVAVDEWTGQSAATTTSLMDYHHVAQSLVKVWKTAESDAFLVDLLVDTRGGTRQGFPRAVIEEIILLRSILGETRAGI